MEKNTDKPRLAQARRDLAALANPTDAANLQRFFKTGPGEYGEGDVFRGIRVPALRQLVPRYAELPRTDVLRLLASNHHEDRLFALLLLVRQFERGNEAQQRQVVTSYLQHTCHINNWDLVDLSAPNIVGTWVSAHDTAMLTPLVRSPSLWERRIAMVATLALIRRQQYTTTLVLAKELLSDREDLLHKATGWMLREVGKRDKATLTGFLDARAATMPRTMLRYAIERFPEEERRRYLEQRKIG
ncbi:MAG: DNA alkylation repair protein [Kiritimatiellia bacterium]